MLVYKSLITPLNLSAFLFLKSKYPKEQKLSVKALIFHNVYITSVSVTKSYFMFPVNVFLIHAPTQLQIDLSQEASSMSLILDWEVCDKPPHED